MNQQGENAFMTLVTELRGESPNEVIHMYFFTMEAVMDQKTILYSLRITCMGIYGSVQRRLKSFRKHLNRWLPGSPLFDLLNGW